LETGIQECGAFTRAVNGALTRETSHDPQGESSVARHRPRRNGQLSTDSGILDETPYSFKTRFENEKGTNPEELIAAAHAGCFTMALAFQLQAAASLRPSSAPRPPSRWSRKAKAFASPARR
jgi:hypothetical protein